jgi:hypothetical protein
MSLEEGLSRNSVIAKKKRMHMFEENYRENIQMVQAEMPSKLNCEPQEKKRTQTCSSQ